MNHTALLEKAKKCKVASRYGIGVDNIDIKKCTELGIVVTNIPDYCLEEVADHAIGMILSLNRRITEHWDLVKNGGWHELNLDIQMDFQTNSDFPENTVFDQDPVAGTKIEEGDTIKLLLSQGTGPMVLLNVIGDSVTDAQRDLEAMGLSVVIVSQEDPVVPLGEIINQIPSAGSEISSGNIEFIS